MHEIMPCAEAQQLLEGMSCPCAAVTGLLQQQLCLLVSHWRLARPGEVL